MPIKWGKLPAEQIFYLRSMGKAFRITAMFDDVNAANAHSAKTDDGVIAEFNGIIYMANLYDPGTPIPKGTAV